MATATKAQTNQDNVLRAIRESGEDGTTIKDVGTATGLSVDSVRKAVKNLEDAGSVKRGEQPGTVFAILKQGRRSVEVVERDEKVYDFIKSRGEEGATLRDVASHLELNPPRLAYESVWRLRKDERVERQGSTRNATWVAVS